MIIVCKNRQNPQTGILVLCSSGTAKSLDHTSMWQKESSYYYSLIVAFSKNSNPVTDFYKGDPSPSSPHEPYEYCAVTSANGSASFFKGALCRDTWKPNSANKVHFVLSEHLETSQLGKDRRGLPCSVLSTLEVSPTFLALGPSPERPAQLCSCDSCFSKEIGGRLEGEHSFPYWWLCTKAWYWSGIQRGTCESSRWYSAKDKLAELFTKERIELNSLQPIGTNP